MSAKNFFIVYHDWWDSVGKMTNEQAELKALLASVNPDAGGGSL